MVLHAVDVIVCRSQVCVPDDRGLSALPRVTVPASFAILEVAMLIGLGQRGQIDSQYDARASFGASGIAIKPH